MKKKDRSSLELMVNGKLTNNPADVAEALNYYFVQGFKVQGFFICHMINYTGYNQK